MNGCVIFLTHADVVIDPSIPVPRWSLNATGRARHANFATSTDLSKISAIYCSDEQKAVDAAEITGAVVGLPPKISKDLGENDRSATGFLPPEEFQATADAFFDEPELSVRGWERAVDAQARIVRAVQVALAEGDTSGDVLCVAHGGVATLLRCYLLGTGISRRQEQIHPNGGCWFAFEKTMTTPPTEWRVI